MPQWGPDCPNPGADGSTISCSEKEFLNFCGATSKLAHYTPFRARTRVPDLQCVLFAPQASHHTNSHAAQPPKPRAWIAEPTLQLTNNTSKCLNLADGRHQNGFGQLLNRESSGLRQPSIQAQPPICRQLGRTLFIYFPTFTVSGQALFGSFCFLLLSCFARPLVPGEFSILVLRATLLYPLRRKKPHLNPKRHGGGTHMRPAQSERVLNVRPPQRHCV